MSNPRNSGLSNATDGRVDRIHMFVRDTSAVSLGVEGMGLHVVDASYETSGLIDRDIGDVVKITGTISPFGTVMQLAPSSAEFLGTYSELGLPASIP